MSHPDRTEISHRVLYVQHEYSLLKQDPHFSASSATALHFAEDEAIREGTLSVEPDDLFLGLLAIPRDNASNLSRFFNSHFRGTQQDQIKKAKKLLHDWRNNGFRQTSQLSYSDEAVAVLRSALDAADDERRQAMPEDILISMFVVGEGNGTGLLYELLPPHFERLSKYLQGIDFEVKGEQRRREYIMGTLPHPEKHPYVRKTVSKAPKAPKTRLPRQRTVYGDTPVDEAELKKIMQLYPAGVPYSLISEAVSTFRAQRGISRAKLGELGGVSAHIIYDLERNLPKKLRAKSFYGIARALGISIEEFAK